ncbi:glycosyltransferase [Microbacterium paludicola]|uniref:D-inositol 3-phosphate glycosyltransferase n=1 Tax=Microbacterium paludicola TaxID=300019 RepID=A0A4Y9FPN8_9MICO|nr:glycosyltransferase family 4 protein [Microbacterium paludicola]MBF0817682.1 glycosyltransferase family 4 protein [Microbacterium paludicola]TFU30269.1 glycosyltransferase [Microbacterium paludicola]
MGKPKIAIVNVFFPPQSIGGATRVVADNARVLGEKYGDEFDLVFYTSDAGDMPEHELEVHSYNGRRVYRAGIIKRPHMDWHPSDKESGRLFARFLEHERPDLVHFHCIQRLTASIVSATRNAGIPYIVTVHDAWWIFDHQFLVDQHGKVHPMGRADPAADIPLPEGIDSEDSEDRRMKLEALLHGAARVVTVSQSFADLYRMNGFPQIEVIENGTKLTGWKPRTASRDGRVRLSHVGGMSAHKGFELLRSILRTERFERLSLTVVDHSKPFGHVERATWGSTPVTIIGKVPQESIADVYAETDVLVAPSIWPESFGLVTREAAAAGCWVVASDIGGIGEQVVEGKTGLKVKAGDRSSLLQALHTIDGDAERFLGRPAPTKVQSVEAQVGRLATVYAETISPTGKSSPSRPNAPKEALGAPPAQRGVARMARSLFGK